MNILHVPQHVQIPVSQVPQPPMQILPEPMNILHVSEPVQIPVSQVPQSPMQILHVLEPMQIPVSQVPQSPVQILHVSEPVQIPVSQVPQSPVQSARTYAASPRARHVGPFGVDRCIRPAHVVRIWTPRTPAASHGTLYF
ncbi:hypothetical protein TNCV_3606431 [Trichonephila clavipes]|nr:hypothetical protein TNCV_3606431 [Trichonephila clavipes]